MSFKPKEMGARLGIKGAFQYRRADGSVIKEVGFSGSIPISSEQAEELKKELENGSDHR